MLATFKLKMGPGWWWLCVLGILAAPCRGIRQCLDGVTINVILLQDEESPWSLNFVEGQIEKALETDATINAAEGNKVQNYNIKTSAWVHKIMLHYGLKIIIIGTVDSAVEIRDTLKV